MYWGGQNDAVFHAPVDTSAIDLPTGTFVNHSIVPNKIDNGKWQTQVGNTGMYGNQNRWIVTTTRDGDISLAYNDEFETRANLTTLDSRARSGTICGACLVPGFCSRKYDEQWGIVLVYKGARDSKFYELSVLRDKPLQGDTAVESLTEQLANAIKAKEAAEAERDKYKADKETAEAQRDIYKARMEEAAKERDRLKEEHGSVDTIVKERNEARAERDRYKTANQQLDARVLQMTNERDAAQSETNKCKAENQQLQAQIYTLQGRIAQLEAQTAKDQVTIGDLNKQVAREHLLGYNQVKELRICLGILRNTSRDGVRTLTTTLTV
jgi:uncharacterized coiled-coil protein SlyX